MFYVSCDALCSFLITPLGINKLFFEVNLNNILYVRGCAHNDSHNQKRTHNHNPTAKFHSEVVLLFRLVLVCQIRRLSKDGSFVTMWPTYQSSAKQRLKRRFTAHVNLLAAKEISRNWEELTWNMIQESLSHVNKSVLSSKNSHEHVWWFLNLTNNKLWWFFTATAVAKLVSTFENWLYFKQQMYS